VTNNWQQQVQQMVDKGKQDAAGMVASGEMIIDAEPKKGFLRIKLRNVQPPHMVEQLTNLFCIVLAKGGAMFNLQVKQRVKNSEETEGG
jgi:hypothetical protein